MNADSPACCGLVLAGGRSTRMGTDKAALVHPDGRTLARRCHDILLDAGCAEVVLSLRHDQGIPPGFDDRPRPAIARDPAGGSDGPLVGMLAAMRLHPEADWIVVACDLPRLDVESLRHLIASKRTDERMLCYRSEFDQLPEPLCTFYGAAALPLLEQAQIAGIRCPRKVLIGNGCRMLEPLVARALENANTPNDWQAAVNP